MSSPILGSIEQAETRLPPEIEYEIFALAFHRNQEDKIQLLRVAKRVLTWLLPFVYESVIMNDYRYPPKAALERYGHHIKNLLVVSFMQPKIPANTILACCPNVRNLAFWNEVRLTERVFDLTQLTHLFTRSLTFFKPYHSSLPEFQSDPPPHRVPRAKTQIFFSTITHLALYDRFNLSTDPGTPAFTFGQILRAFTSLTHLLVYNYTSYHELQLALGLCPSIKVLICLDCTCTDPNETFVLPPYESPKGDDWKVVMMDGYFTRDWKRGILGEKDMWKLADEVIARRISEMQD
ncbi:hypothetical protein BDN72DRAFT_861405 [Pluteus cervinus]|uniref:Uncharacterized protein n=1 Tax=Pluteus cervinus TaxID=181527 RepID=A0ACD3AFT9_9AGAR|nr:hypothetical protein BDN72DRAFT_861405 [Pluteus cervinus]